MLSSVESDRSPSLEPSSIRIVRLSMAGTQATRDRKSRKKVFSLLRSARDGASASQVTNGIVRFCREFKEKAHLKREMDIKSLFDDRVYVSIVRSSFVVVG
jgi:hypothetical protein